MTLGLRPHVLRVGLVVGICLRLAVLALVDYRFDVGDARSYRQVAHNIVNHGVFSDDVSEFPVPNAYRPPLYPATLASIAVLAGESTRAVQVFQLLLTLLTGFLITAIAERHAPAAAPWAFLGMMLSPFEAVYAGALLSEGLATFLLVGATAAVLLLSGWKRWVIAGIASGLLVLCRDIYLPLVLLFVALWLWRGQGPLRRRTAEALLFLTATAVIILPWTLRNTALLGSIVPVSQGRLGYSLWLATWAVSGDFTKSDAVGERVYPPEATRNDQERRLLSEATATAIDPRKADAIFRGLALARLRDEPLAVFGRSALRWPRLWIGTRYDIFALDDGLLPRDSLPWKVVKSSLWGLNFGLLLLGVSGVVIALRRRSPIAWASLPIAFTGAAYFPLNSFENRYSQPVLALVVLFASITSAEMSGWCARRHSNRSSGLAKSA